MMNKSTIKSIALVGHESRTSNSYGRNLAYMRYTVLLSTQDGKTVNIANAFSREDLKELSYWSARSKTMSMTCWGTSQLFECQISLGRWLGFDEKDWSAFSHKCTEFIKQVN